MKAEKELKVRAPLEDFRHGNFIRVCSPWDRVLPDTYLVDGYSHNSSGSHRLVSTRDWMPKMVIHGISPMRFDEVVVDLYERDKRLNAPR